MFTSPEHFSEATKANFETFLAGWSSLTNKTIESVEKIVELNMTVAKTAFEESNAAAKQLIAAKDAQEFLSLTAAHVQPSADKALAYARHVATIANGAQAEYTKAAEAQVADANRKAVAFVDELTKNAPAGSEDVVKLFKTAIGNANAGYDQFKKSTKQVSETLEANLNSAVSQIAQATTKATSRAKKA